MTPVSGRHYANAPITEALIDIQAQLPPASDLGKLARIQQAISQDYPGKQRQELHQFQVQVFPGQPEGAKTEDTILGFRLSSSDGKQIVQVRRNGFSFSRLTPYENWGRMRDEARRLWSLYSEAVRPTKITRVAVRYINQINIPLPMNDFADYVLLSPQVPPGMSQDLSNYFMRLEQPQPDIGAHLVLITAMLQPTDPSVCSVALDIDVFGQSLEITDDKEAWELLESLRQRKDQIFEACITDQTRRIIS